MDLLIDEDYKELLKCLLVDRYFGYCPQIDRLIEKMIFNLHNNSITLDKVSRMLGYIQGTLIERRTLLNPKRDRYMTVLTERDYTRPIFQAYYKSRGINQQTIEV